MLTLLVLCHNTFCYSKMTVIVVWALDIELIQRRTVFDLGMDALASVCIRNYELFYCLLMDAMMNSLEHALFSTSFCCSCKLRLT